MRAFTLRDPAFLGSAEPAAPISDTDADTWGWWSGDKFMAVVAGTYEVDTWGNRMAYQADKTDKTASTNLYSYGSLSNMRPSYSRNDTKGNMFRVSNSIMGSTWSASNFTKNTATTGTFTAQNGYIAQLVYYTRPGVTYRLRANIRAVSGNTNLHWYHNGAASGNSTAVTVNGVLTEYTVTFTGHATAGTVTVGLQDQNAAGHGQIEVTEWHLIENTWDTTYVENTSATCGQFPTIDGKRCVFTGEPDYLLDMNGVAPAPAFSDPCTIYLLWRPRYLRANGILYVGKNPLWDIYADLNTTDESIYVNEPPYNRIDTGSAVTVDTWRVHTAVFNGASSSIRINKAAAITGTLGPVGSVNTGIQLGGDIFGGNMQDMAIYEFIVRTVADNTTVQDTFIEYLAARVGLSV